MGVRSDVVANEPFNKRDGRYGRGEKDEAAQDVFIKARRSNGAAPAGRSVGWVEKNLTKPTRIKGHVAKPTKNEPQYLVRSEKSGKVAAHTPRELRKRASR